MKQYLDYLRDIRLNGVDKDDRTGTGTRSIFGRNLEFDLTEGFPLLTTKKLHTRSIIHELLWFLRGDTNIKYLNENGVTIWDEWADEGGWLGPVYGKQWVAWDLGYLDFDTKQPVTINQISWLVDRLQTNPDCRRLLVSAWNVEDLDKMALMPCHYAFQVWTRELSIHEREVLYEEACFKEKRLTWKACPIISGFEKAYHKRRDEEEIPRRALSLMWQQRSVDSFLGLPFNIASYAFLTHMLAQQVNMVPERLVFNGGDCHIYSNHVNQVEEQLSRKPRTLPILRLKKADSIFDYQYEDFEIVDYNPYPSIKAPIAV